MKRIAALCAAAALASTLTACAPPPAADTRDADLKALKDTEASWNQAFAAKDAARAASFYTDDAVFIVAGSPATTGRDAIQKEDATLMSDPAFAVTFHSTRADVAKSGDLGYTSGPYTLDVTNPLTKQVVHDHGSYVTAYRKQADGSWKATLDSVTSEVPPPAPPAPGKKK